MVSASFKCFGFMTFLALVNTERLNLDLNFHFCAKSYFILAFVQNFNHFDSQL